MRNDHSDNARQHDHEQPPEGHSPIGKIAVAVAFLGIVAFFVFALVAD
ncbi:hypothetical protein C7446_2947 [Kushneria sinocarnis]|uniref:Uncharacterized protein n=1 Tax=Kushneria sinocarnis TaxID=595502 RepID=A0A420WTI1_9GAMM|nr:hypothetical protein [Kushneria sinocarnis]RKQ96355.1 hypothetical protein C7446_2947 [Kushneria sinocarnis]